MVHGPFESGEAEVEAMRDLNLSQPKKNTIRTCCWESFGPGSCHHHFTGHLQFVFHVVEYGTLKDLTGFVLSVTLSTS